MPMMIDFIIARSWGPPAWCNEENPPWQPERLMTIPVLDATDLLSAQRIEDKPTRAYALKFPRHSMSFPFSVFFVEAKFLPLRTNEDYRYGGLINVIDAKNDIDAFAQEAACISAFTTWPEIPDLLKGASAIFRLDFLSETHDNFVVGPHLCVYALIDEGGLLMGRPGERFIITVPAFANMSQKDYNNSFPASNLMALLVFHMAELMACRNVHLELKKSSRSMQKQHQRNYQHPLVDYHVLTVSLPSDKSHRQIGTSGDPGTGKRLHICRGHFAEYGEEKKLFGKYSGRFFVPAHLKGRKERGVLLKDYHLSPNKPR